MILPITKASFSKAMQLGECKLSEPTRGAQSLISSNHSDLGKQSFKA
jgi:hypothetical protein